MGVDAGVQLERGDREETWTVCLLWQSKKIKVKGKGEKLINSLQET
jgi:hypothetical protein